MIQKVYFNRYRQAVERSLSSRRPAQEARENKSTCSEENPPGKFAQERPGAVKKQSNSIPKDAVEVHAGKNVIDGFKEIAPGIYQFRQPMPGGKGYDLPPKLIPLYQPVITKRQNTGELGFQRIDGIPGPYQNYSTPVFQFT